MANTTKEFIALHKFFEELYLLSHYFCDFSVCLFEKLFFTSFLVPSHFLPPRLTLNNLLRPQFLLLMQVILVLLLRVSFSFLCFSLHCAAINYRTFYRKLNCCFTRKHCRNVKHIPWKSIIRVRLDLTLNECLEVQYGL